MRALTVAGVQTVAHHLFLVANGDVTVSSTGTLSNVFANETLRFNGSTLTNNGTISIANLEFHRSGAQSIAGSGMWTGGNININGSGTNVSLSGAQTFGISDTLTLKSTRINTSHNPISYAIF